MGRLQVRVRAVSTNTRACTRRVASLPSCAEVGSIPPVRSITQAGATMAHSRINTHRQRFDICLAARCMDKNARVAAEVLADDDVGDALHHNARRLVEVTRLNLDDAVQQYLKAL